MSVEKAANEMLFLDSERPNVMCQQHMRLSSFRRYLSLYVPWRLFNTIFNTTPWHTALAEASHATIFATNLANRSYISSQSLTSLAYQQVSPSPVLLQPPSPSTISYHKMDSIITNVMLFYLELARYIREPIISNREELIDILNINTLNSLNFKYLLLRFIKI